VVKQIAKTGGFALQPQNMSEAMEMANMLAGSQMVPRNYQGKPQDALVAMMMGTELGLNPIQSLQHIAVINGRPSIYGDALLALVQSHPKFGGIEETFDDSKMTAYCTVWRKDGTKHTQAFSAEDAQAAGLWGKQGPWKQYPKRMLAWRARGFAVRNQFADALAGLITVEEARDMPEDTGPRYMGQANIEPEKAEDRPERVQKILEELRGSTLTESDVLHAGGIQCLEEIEEDRIPRLIQWIQSKPKESEQ
jgi:hypothetical protein